VTLTLPDVTIHEEVPGTCNGEECVRLVIEKARELSDWALEYDIGPENYLLKVEGVDYFINSLHLELHRVRIMPLIQPFFFFFFFSSNLFLGLHQDLCGASLATGGMHRRESGAG
jgi:hypothetical protein